MIIADQPPPKPAEGPAIQDLVIADIEERKRIGMERYGTLLHAFNGRMALVDAYQEILDLACYVRQEIEEQAAEVSRPEIVVLCGSTRFYDAFRAQNLRLTTTGKIVLSIGCDTKSDGDLAAAGQLDLDALKDRLDELHKRKIDLADRVFVLNVGGYIGESTRSEIEYAEKIGRPVDYLEPLS